MRLHICGARGSTPAPGAAYLRYGGHTSCVAVAHDGDPPTLIIDAGTGLATVDALLDGRAFRGTILLGHLHWDHTYGLPFFSSGDDPDARVRLMIPAQGDALEVLTRVVSPPYFPITPRDFRGEWSFEGLEPGLHDIEGFSVLALDVTHKGGRTFGFRISDGRGTVAYISDHDAAPGRAGDFEASALELARGADLLIHDSQYTDGEDRSWSRFGHSTFEYAIGLAEAARVGRLMLFHHSPRRTDEQVDDLLERARSMSRLEVIAGMEGMVVDVPRAASAAVSAFGVPKSDGGTAS